MSLTAMTMIVGAAFSFERVPAEPRKLEARIQDAERPVATRPAITVVQVRSTASTLTSQDRTLAAPVDGKASTRAASAPPPPPASPAPAPAQPATEPSLSSPANAEELAARAECARSLAGLAIEWEPVTTLQEGACGALAPIRVRRLGEQRTELSPPAVMTCALAITMQRWVDGVLQPAARDLLGQQVLRLGGVQAYSCRNRNNAKAGPISEHAFANAIDITSMHLADGRVITVQNDWGPVARDAVRPDVMGPVKPPLPVTKASAKRAESTPDAIQPAAQLLRRAHSGACPMFSTVLGPEANDAHRDHLHFDLKLRARKGLCE